MELIGYAVNLIGLLAACSAIVLFAFARLPVVVLAHGERAGRYAGLGAAQLHSVGTRADGHGMAFDVPKAHAA